MPPTVTSPCLILKSLKSATISKDPKPTCTFSVSFPELKLAANCCFALAAMEIVPDCCKAYRTTICANSSCLGVMSVVIPVEEDEEAGGEVAEGVLPERTVVVDAAVGWEAAEEVAKTMPSVEAVCLGTRFLVVVNVAVGTGRGLGLMSAAPRPGTMTKRFSDVEVELKSIMVFSEEQERSPDEKRERMVEPLRTMLNCGPASSKTGTRSVPIVAFR